MEFNPPIIKRGKLVASGASVVLTMPREWLNENKLNIGDEVMIVSNGDLKIMKMDKERIEKLRRQLNNQQGSLAQETTSEGVAK